jgi:hypothetical protein
VNASTALGCLGVLQHGYITQHPVFWNDTQAGGTVELVYFQQMTPWQAQRCVVTEAKGSIVSVAQPCFEMISQFVKNECFHGHTHNVTRDLASGLPYTLENLPLPGLNSSDRKDGQFWFSKERHQLWYRPHESELSSDGKQMTAAVVVPVSEGLVMATGAHDVLFEGVDFEYSAWNQASTGEGFIDLQDGVHLRPVNGNSSVTAAHNILGAIDCVNCTAVSLSKCTLSRMGGTAVSFGGVSKGNSVSASHISDTSCAGVNIDGYYSSDPAFPDAWRSTNNSVTGTVVAFTAREYTGCVGIQAGWVGLAFTFPYLPNSPGAYSYELCPSKPARPRSCNQGLQIAHNTISTTTYGAVSVGCGAAHAGYARDNSVAYNLIEGWMLGMQDSGAVYMTGVQPGSSVHHNYMRHQGLTALEAPWGRVSCDSAGPFPAAAAAAAGGARCSVDDVIAWEDGNSTGPCMEEGHVWCNQGGGYPRPGMHGGAIYPDNGSSGWDVFANVMQDVFNWAFIWDGSGRMKDMLFRDCYTDSRLFTNNGAAHNVTFEGNTFVNRTGGEPWPSAAEHIMAAAGAPVLS